MGKRYHCDYCARSFQDTLHNRKKHLNGVQHHRAKKAWFDNFRDAAAILQDERAKQGCRKFLQTGQCVFGPSCRYSHMSEQDIKDLEQHIHEERQQMVDLDQEEASAKPSLEEWLSRREKRAAPSSGSVLKLEEEKTAKGIEVPTFLLSIPDLPPSLLPLHSGRWRGKVHTDWG
ncbi:zinc finger matrin-type protein 5 isoform X1 [Ictalurus furcatus]|uniref:zinc finger matrin-type protein 5 isoform X1 n=1 Tax=Ictalurus furcatus TaxID=66913 RepID=UPI002350FB54|nr:zinc finger matrin-type protein 5 isoform X1 [Ictalurus furcatus]XP_053473692.1 zinc finger matrin-type protein 5 isoform X1 [Ictalurus furcatus]XP_053473693.1 zinc finger matrin-type protein 5 isoform X1 [Ictalurus furcatus]XP_053473694.1 zinc finger matrin-type protein 5 isoform X1 [Ictalurus furcatus]